MATQNFRVKNGLEVGSATTIATDDAYIGSNLSVAGVATFLSDVNISGSIISGGGGAVSVDDLTARNIYATGISTFVGAISGSSATFSGDLTVGGELKYEDVVNVDSIGIATARSGLRITGGGLDVVGVSTFSDDIDLNSDLDVAGNTQLNTVNVSGASTFVGVTTTQDNVFVGNDLSVAGDARVVGVLTVGSSSITLDGSSNTINVGHGVTIHTTTASVNQLEVAGLSTFTGIVTTNHNVFVGNNLSVAGDARVVGVLTVGSGTITIDGETNTINVGTGATLHTTTVAVNQLEVVGLSTFIGIATFKNDVYAQQLNVTELIVNGGASLGEDITTRNLSASGIVTVTGTTDLNGDLDVDGHTELDQLNVSGVSTFVGVSTFQNKVVFDSTNSIQIPAGDTSQRDPSPVAGQIRYNSQLSSFEGYGPGNAWGSLGGVKDVDQDTYIIPESSAGSDEDTLYFYNAGSNTATISSTTATLNVDFSVAGVSTFTGNIDANGDLDVDGHTELDNVNITGVLTATSAEFSGNVTVLGDLTYENVVNVDSIGIATARAGLRVTGGGLVVSGVSTFSNGVNVSSGNTYQINGVDVISATTLGAGVTNSSLRYVSANVISDRIELTTGQPSGSDYILLYDADVGDLKKSTIQNAALQGVQGVQGTQGIQGIQGVQGTQGIQGTQGTQGIQGIQGIQGTFGTQGVQGTFGPVAGSANQVVYKDSGNNPAGSVNLTFDGGTLDASNVNVSGILTATTIVGDGSNITGISTNHYKGELVAFDNVLDSDITISSDYKTAIIYVDQDLTLDVEEGVTITIDDGCYLNIIS